MGGYAIYSYHILYDGTYVDGLHSMNALSGLLRIRPSVINMTLAKVDGDGRLTTQCKDSIDTDGKKEIDGHETSFFDKDLTTVERILVIICIVLAAAIVIFYTSIQPSK